jgi:N-acyl-D-aspartate/D-glutamate deacylase
MLDIAIRGGEVIDGSGSARYVADVGIQGERIVAVGQVGEAALEIDARGMAVSPGSSMSTLISTPRCSGTGSSRRRHSTG